MVDVLGVSYLGICERWSLIAKAQSITISNFKEFEFYPWEINNMFNARNDINSHRASTEGDEVVEHRTKKLYSNQINKMWKPNLKGSYLINKRKEWISFKWYRIVGTQ